MHDGQLTLTCLRVKPNHRLKRLRSDVVGRREEGVIDDATIVCLHPLRDALLVPQSSESTAHFGSPSVQLTCALACLATK
jgi:hypothetical protein